MTKQGISKNVLGFLSVVACLVYQLVNWKVMANECGIISIPRGLTIEENQTKKGVWPFAAALYEKKESRLLCGGTLISTRHILTGNKLKKTLNSHVKVSLSPIDTT